MICPICKNPVPFGLPMHMIAAHGKNEAAYERETARIKAEQTPKAKKWSKRGGPGGKKSGRPRLKRPIHSKLA